MYSKRNVGALMISCFVAMSALAGCGNAAANGTAANTSAPAKTTTTAAANSAADTEKTDASANDSTSGTEPIKVAATIFPEYDWVKQIMGDKAANAEITYLLESGVDLHNFQPTADDIIKISDCDLFVYVGGESDEWVEDALEGAVNKDMKVINLMKTMGDKAKLEEVKEGMQHDHEDGEEDHDHEHEHEHEETEYDEHVWLSLVNAKFLCGKITDALCEIDPANADIYKANFAAYSGELDALHSDFQKLTDSAAVKTVVFGDRFPFRYFVDDYGLDYFAAFTGCSAETEASFETVIFLTQKMDELGCKTIYTIENSDKSIAQTIIGSTQAKDQTVAELNSLQSVSRADIDGGATYLSLMRGNYDVLAETLK
ncbi:MAG: zinc ABC transporter substrate-binding protein [Ruminiclostridium sp.]|nr:zinc ABC transporter substrate-binding protein [Ruminiclostridium sp.]